MKYNNINSVGVVGVLDVDQRRDGIIEEINNCIILIVSFKAN